MHQESQIQVTDRYYQEFSTNLVMKNGLRELDHEEEHFQINEICRREGETIGPFVKCINLFPWYIGFISKRDLTKDEITKVLKLSFITGLINSHN